MNIYHSIKSLVTQQRVARAASTLGEKDEDVQKAIDAIIPSLLGALYTKGATPAVKETLDLAGQYNLRAELDNIYEGSGIVDGINLGERFENALIGVHNSDFPRSISKHSGISVESADRLGNWVSGTIAAWFGDMTGRQVQSLNALIGQLGNERQEFAKDIPEGVACELNLLVPGACSSGKKKPKVWIWWVIIVLLVIGIIIMISRSCSTRNTRIVELLPGESSVEYVHTLADNCLLR